MRSIALGLGAVAAAAAVLAARRRTRLPDSVRIVDPEGRPTIDVAGGARSVQAAEMPMTDGQIAVLWSPIGLERLGRTYWRFLPEISLGLIQVRFTAAERLIVLGARPLVLLSFFPPEYEITDERSAVRWRIRGGLLLARRGRPSRGSLQIGVRRLAATGHAATGDSDGRPGIHVEVAVVDFVPSIAGVFGRRVYGATQSRIHVIVSHAFLRSLARRDLAGAPAEGEPGA
jgi:hypothetical protein